MILLRSYCLFNLEEVITNILKMNTSKVTFGVAAASLLCFLHSAVMDALKKIKVLLQILLFKFFISV